MGRAQNTVKRGGFWRPGWSAAGAAAPLSYGEERTAFGYATARGPLAGFKGCRPCRRPRKQVWWISYIWLLVEAGKSWYQLKKHINCTLRSKKLPLSLQGQQIVWLSSVQGGLQGVTELTRCERTQDVWLQELQGELRVGRLSEDNHAFLHGQPTRVPGSWCARTQQPTCGENICYRLYKNGSTPAAILKYECAGCRAERESKRLVAVAPDDPRFLPRVSAWPEVFSIRTG